VTILRTTVHHFIQVKVNSPGTALEIAELVLLSMLFDRDDLYYTILKLKSIYFSLIYFILCKLTSPGQKLALNKKSVTLFN
jgi:hypothetical protein